MPRVTATISGGAATPMNGTYPKLLQGDSGSIWLVTAPKVGTIVYLSGKPQKAKHSLGYSTAKLVENKMRVFEGTVALKIAA